MGEAACAEEITQQSVLKEEPAYERYETRYAERERERHKEYISYETRYAEREREREAQRVYLLLTI